MIRTSQLSYQYPDAAALVFPDVDVPQGAVLLLSGASGSGKSTWLALVGAMVPPTGGRLVVAGQELGPQAEGGLKPGAAADAWRARTVGFLPQRLHLSAALSVFQNLAFAQWAAGVAQDTARIASVLQSLGVADLAQRKPDQISGGQAQRVALARAVLMQPRVILADEPTASLDDEAAAVAVHLLAHTARQAQATLVIATHDARVRSLLQTPKGGAESANVFNLVLSKK